MSGQKLKTPEQLEENRLKIVETFNRGIVPEWIIEHIRTYIESPAQGHLWDGSFAGGRANAPTLLLTTTGRKSGRHITMPLLYGQDGDNYIIVGSKGGAPQHPAWYLNLQANPQVEVQVVEKRFRARARTAVGEERQRLWQLMVDVHPPYPDYQKSTTRVLPVVVLEEMK